MQKSAEKRLLIAGIDPGTNKGYAFLDIDGNLVKSGSSKTIELDEMIAESINYGRAIVVGCDKNPAPDAVARFAVKTGSRLIVPDNDLLAKEKELLIENFEMKLAKEHEKDAIASAVFAFRRISPLLNKINELLKKEGKIELRNKIVEMVLKKGISIRTAVKLLEEPETDERRIVQKIIEDKKLEEDDFFELIERLRVLENELKLVKRQNNGLRQEVEAVKREKRVLLKRPRDFEKKLKENNSFKEKAIYKLDKDIEDKNKIILEKNREIENLNRIILDFNDKIILKKLDNLGFNEFELKNKRLNIKEGDILFVKDIDSFSEKAIDFLRDKIQFIVFGKGNNKKLPFNLINAKNIKIEENGLFVLVDKEDFEKEIKKLNMLDKVINEYKEERGY